MCPGIEALTSQRDNVGQQITTHLPEHLLAEDDVQHHVGAIQIIAREQSRHPFSFLSAEDTTYVYSLERIDRPFTWNKGKSIRLGLEEYRITIGWTVADFALSQSAFVDVD